jgi:hypothetical protein
MKYEPEDHNNKKLEKSLKELSISQRFTEAILRLKEVADIWPGLGFWTI